MSAIIRMLMGWINKRLSIFLPKHSFIRKNPENKTQMISQGKLITELPNSLIGIDRGIRKPRLNNKVCLNFKTKTAITKMRRVVIIKISSLLKSRK
jgi:hypothetical protein